MSEPRVVAKEKGKEKGKGKDVNVESESDWDAYKRSPTTVWPQPRRISS